MMVEEEEDEEGVGVGRRFRGLLGYQRRWSRGEKGLPLERRRD
jgi:hypothetical protein